MVFIELMEGWFVKQKRKEGVLERIEKGKNQWHALRKQSSCRKRKCLEKINRKACLNITGHLSTDLIEVYNFLGIIRLSNN